jgi:competence/damage-inducible protein CinA-like protein
MPKAEIIAIGTELLLGVITDTNTAHIARELNQAGIDVYRTVMIGDNQKRIAEEIQNSTKRADIVITTGGLGPTVDDPTRNAVAEAFGRELVFLPELWAEINERFFAYGKSPSDNNRRQAYIPQGSIPISNPVGTAPAFYLKDGKKVIFSLPGVPSEMKTLLQIAVLPIILKEFQITNTIFTRIIHTAGIGESSIDKLISEMELRTNPTVGLSAHPGQVDIRITAKAKNSREADQMIRPLEEKIFNLLDENIYGTDRDTLNDIVQNLIKSLNLAIIIRCASNHDEAMLQKTSLQKLASPSGPEKSLNPMYNDNNQRITITLRSSRKEPHALRMEISHQNNQYQKELRFGGHPNLYYQWVENQVLFNTWKYLLLIKGDQ